MAQPSTQHKLDRVRPPRVQVTYDVEVGDAIEVRTLPFHIAVLGDFSGTPAQSLPRLRDRAFVEVNPDNFDQVLEGMHARLAYTVENRLAETDGAPALRVDLHFKSLEDFDPSNVARQIKPLRELLELRTMLNDLLGKLQGNDRLEELLTEVVTDPEMLKKLEAEVRASTPEPAPVETEAIAAEAIAAESPADEAPVDEPPEPAEELAVTEEVAVAETPVVAAETTEEPVAQEAIAAEPPQDSPVLDAPAEEVPVTAAAEPVETAAGDAGAPVETEKKTE